MRDICGARLFVAPPILESSGASVQLDARNLTPNPFPSGKGDRINREEARRDARLGHFRAWGEGKNCYGLSRTLQLADALPEPVPLGSESANTWTLMS